MNTKIKVCGNMLFNPKSFTNKHNKQSSWKKVTILEIGGDLSELYAWFLSKKGLILNPPLRGAHVTFVNDRSMNFLGSSIEAKELLWDNVSKMFNGNQVELELELTPYSDGTHWWLRVHPDSRGELNNVRKILFGDKNFQYIYGFHMTIGHANEKNIIHSQYLRYLEEYGFKHEKTREFTLKTLGVKL